MTAQFNTIAHFRELGGCKTTDGKTIKKGYIYRSGELTHVSKKEQIILNSLNIKTVYDLRSIREQQESPDIEGNYRIVLCPLANPERNADEKYKKRINYIEKMRHVDQKYYNFGKFGFGKGYSDFAYNTKTVAKIIESLNRHETFLFHCFGGKDRTGVIAMIIMLSLGCDYEECKKNYMLHKKITVEEQKEYIEFMKKSKFSEYGIKLERYYSEVHEELFDVAYCSIFDVYNTIDEYLEDLYGISREQIDDWRKFYLE